MLEVNKTHEDFSNVSEDEKKKTENPEKRRGEDFGATSPGGIFSYASLEKLWNQTGLDIFLSWATVHNFFVGCFCLFIVLQAYKVSRVIELEVRGRGYILWRKNPLWFPTTPFCSSPGIEIVEYAKGSSEKLEEAKIQIAQLKQKLKQKAPAVPAGDPAGDPVAVTVAVPVPDTVPDAVGKPVPSFGALKKKRISLKR